MIGFITIVIKLLENSGGRHEHQNELRNKQIVKVPKFHKPICFIPDI